VHPELHPPLHGSAAEEPVQQALPRNQPVHQGSVHQGGVPGSVPEARSLLPEGQNRVRGVWQSLQGHHGVPQAKQESGKLREWHLQ